MPSDRVSQPRRLRVEALEHREVPAAVAAVLTTGVDNDNYLTTRPTDWNGTDDLLSLREAIRMVNQGAASVIDFDGRTVQIGTTVDPTGELGNITKAVTVRGGTLDGNGLRGGLSLTAGGTVRDMTVVRVENDIALGTAGKVLIENNFFGTDATGTPGLGNEAGVSVGGNSGTFRNNVVTTTGGPGLSIGGSYNKVVGNKIGVAPDGVTVLGIGGSGISMGNRSPDGSTAVRYGNVIGGPTEADRNIIVGFDEAGVFLSFSTQSTRVVGNYIGLTAAGTVPAGGSDGDGIFMEGTAKDSIIGGPGGNRNWITGVNRGVRLTFGNTLTNNVIGLQTDGTAPLLDKNDVGVVIAGNDNAVGAAGAGNRNIISGNAGAGILAGAGSNKIQNNWIGLDLTGKAGTAAAAGAGNGGAGIELRVASRTTVGGGPGAGNAIAGNEGPGVWITGEFARLNQVRGNTIGLDAGGTPVTLALGDRGNRGGGVLIDNKATENSVGVSGGRANVISGNTGAGVRISGTATTGNAVLANRIGTDLAGTQTGLGNGVGVVVETSANDNRIGDGTGAGRNVISGNVGDGVQINGADETRVRSNYIGTTAAGTGALGNGGDGIHIGGGSGESLVKNTVAFNTGFGIRADAGTANTFDANAIYTNTAGGISLAAGANAAIGRPTIQRAIRTSSRVTVEGLAATRPGQALTVQLFGSPAARADGTGEGTRYLGQVRVTTGADGAFRAVFSVGVPVGFRVLTITITDADGNTSEFSPPALEA